MTNLKPIEILIYNVLVVTFKNVKYEHLENQGSGSGYAIKTHKGITLQECAEYCNKKPTCAGFTYFDDKKCRLKSKFQKQDEIQNDRDSYVKLSGV